MIKKTCKYSQCNKEFVAQYNHQYYCCHKCSDLNNHFRKICKRCGVRSFGYLCNKCFRTKKGSTITSVFGKRKRRGT